MPEYATPSNWISDWLDLQPLTRFKAPKESVMHPSSLLHPSSASAQDWSLFWHRYREVTFRVLFGLQMLSLHSSNASRARMNAEDWTAWADDVLGVLYQLIDQYVFNSYLKMHMRTTHY